jgi:uncharacterized protein (TIGR03083 family)
VERDANLWIEALRSGHDRLATFVGGASAADLGRVSMCTDWTVGQVLAHLGSGAEIAYAHVTGTPVDNPAVWAYWDGLDASARAPSFVQADERLLGWYESLPPDERANRGVQFPYLPEPVSVAQAAGYRLSEIGLHSWDVFAPFDRSATVAPDATRLLIDRLPMMVELMGRRTPRETRPAEATTIGVTTWDPDRQFELELGDGIELRPSAGGPTAGDLRLPAEALLRLAAGRLPTDRDAGASVTGVLTLDDLRTAFPGY